MEHAVKYRLEQRIKLDVTAIRRRIYMYVWESQYSASQYFHEVPMPTLAREPTQHIENVVIGLRLRIPLHALVRFPWIFLYSAHDERFLCSIYPAIFDTGRHLTDVK